MSRSLQIAIIEVIGFILILSCLLFNYKKTKKMDSLSDQLNVTASDYTIYLEFSDEDREKMLQERGISRGEQCHIYVRKLVDLDGVNIVRIDLVQDNREMIRLLEMRGEALKL